MESFIIELEALIKKYKDKEIDESRPIYFNLCHKIKNYDFGKEYRGKGFKTSSSLIYKLIRDIYDDGLSSEYKENEILEELNQKHKEQNEESKEFIEKFICEKRKNINWNNKKYIFKMF